MKLRTTAFALALAMALGLLSACGSKEEPQQTPAPAPSVSAPAEPDTPQLPTPEVDAPETESPEVETQPAPLPEPEAVLSLNKSDFTLFKTGDNYTLKAKAAGTDESLVWSSSDEAVATVAEDGTVTAVAPGTATITVTAGELSASCVVRCNFEEDVPASGGSTGAGTVSVDLAAFYETIMTSAGENAPFMMELDSEMVEMIYPGIGAVELKQQALYMPGMSAVACEISMVECVNAADVETVKAIFQSRIDTQVDGGAWYPETIEGWKNNAKIVVKGNYVALFVIPEGMMDAAAEFEKLF